MKKILPPILISAALGAAVLLSKKGSPSRESLLPLSRSVADQEKGLDRASSAAFPLSPEEERRIGEEMSHAISDGGPAPDAADAALLRRWLALGARAADSPLVSRFRGRYAFYGAGGECLNAFALPGGLIYATMRLLRKFGTDEGALLFVAAHEIGHVELGHCADAYRLRASRDPARAVLGGVLSLGRLFAQLHFNKTQELEADQFAVRLMRSIGADARGAARAFDLLDLGLDSGTKRDPGAVAVEGLADYFKTHPGSWERRAALERQIGGSP